jgi:hypothetical protein
MSISDKLKNISNNVQHTSQQVAHSLGHIILRVLSGFFVAAVLALIAQEIVQFGNFILLFVLVVLMSLIFRVLSRFSIGQILIFDLICVLIGTLLRMYILIAPN